MTGPIPYYVVDAFTSERFRGNPAGVCILDRDLGDGVMQSIALENNLSETAFVSRGEGAGKFSIRWFTPTTEVDLCGHATLGSAFVLMTEIDPALKGVRFESASGALEVARIEEGRLALDFPARVPERIETPARLREGLLREPIETWRAHDLLAVFETEADVRAMQPDFGVLSALPGTGVIVTAPGETCDFVSRFFAPGVGIDEDPVTGAAHCSLVPYWSKRLNRARLHARQISERGGELFCEDRGERVSIGGHAVIHLRGEIAAI